MDYSNAFFAGCESLMEDNVVEAEADVTVTPEEEVQEANEVVEEVQGAEETAAEIEQGEQQAEMAFRKFEEIDRMVAHVERYGVDRAFLSLCNHDNILGKSFGLQLPATESYDAVGSPNSPESIAAMEGLKDVARKVYEFIKRMIARLGDWLVRIGKMYDVRKTWIKAKCKRLRARVEALGNNKKDKSEIDKLKDTTIHNFTEYDTFRKACMPTKFKSTELDTAKVPELPKFPEEKSYQISNTTNPENWIKVAEDLIETAEDNLKEVGEGRADIAKLNTEVAKAEREDNKKEADKIKETVKAAINSVKIKNQCISALISAAGKAASEAAKIIDVVYKGSSAAKKDEKK